MIPNVLSIAGSDPSGGAGIQADLKTFAAHKCHGMSVITALTAQNTTGVRAVENVSPAFVDEQLSAIFEDIDVAAVKIGMVSHPAIIGVIAVALNRYKPQHVVFDPVMASQSGHALINDDAIEALKDSLIPHTHIITPNMPEAEILLGTQCNADDMQANAKELLDLGAGAVLLKGGHDTGDQSTDILATQNGILETLSAPRIDTKNNHGTGCTLSSAIAARLAHGDNMLQACKAAKQYITTALENSDKLNVGNGHGPVNHFVSTE